MKVLIVLVIIGILLLCSINSSKLPEGFEPLNPGNVPCVSEQPILYGDYPVKKDPMVSNLGSQQLWKFYPTFPVGSYKQETNNINTGLRQITALVLLLSFVEPFTMIKNLIFLLLLVLHL